MAEKHADATLGQAFLLGRHSSGMGAAEKPAMRNAGIATIKTERYYW